MKYEFASGIFGNYKRHFRIQPLGPQPISLTSNREECK